MRQLIKIIVLVFFTENIFSQQVLLFSEDFEQPSSAFVFDTGGIGNTSGSNRWIINSEFDGQGIYANTTNQDSTFSGTITNAPFSTYLHIHDENATAGIANANYDPTIPSDRFVYTRNGFCTLGLEDIVLAFFYVSEGSSTAYGEVYYSIDGGAWTKTGAAQYNNQAKWKYATVTDSLFENVTDLRFGFRWVNDAGSPPAGISFGLDDIIVAGTYDSINSPVNITIPQIFSDTVCRSIQLLMGWHLSRPLCGGTYRIELSNSAGNFNNPTNLGVIGIQTPDTSGFLFVTIPGTVPPGNCYKLRMNRLTPAPSITGAASACFVVQACPNIIATVSSAVVTDPDTVCSRSAIDITFLSGGVFNAGNVYTAQLSDANGSFNNPQFIGNFPSSKAYDPSVGSLPGTVSGLLPSAPEGCNYFIRITSSNPVATGSLLGPFCIRQCDITTNNTSDLHVCIHDTVGLDDTIQVDIHSWNTNASYFNGNSFSVQLLDRQSLGVVNEGGLGVALNTTSTNLTLTVPGLNDLLLLGISPGNYYMRIIADSSSVLNNLGTIIRLTIGAPADNPPLIIPDDSVYCNNEIGEFLITPDNPASDYEWLSAALYGGVPFVWQYNPLRVDWTGAAVGAYSLWVREINFGCYGSYSPTAEVDVVSLPTISINGDNTVCSGTESEYQVPFLAHTYFEWTASGAIMTDTSNNEASFSFGTSGTAEINVFVVNVCGARSGTFDVNVLPEASISFFGFEDTNCNSISSVILDAEPAGGIFSGTGVSSNQFSPSSAGVGTHPVTYFVTDTNGCSAMDTISLVVELCDGITTLSEHIKIYPVPAKENVYLDFESALHNSNPVTIQVVDLTGKIFNPEFNVNSGTISVDVSSFPSGAYWMIISFNKRQSVKSFFVKE